MAKAAVYNLKREKVGEVELAADVFEAPVNEGLLYDVVKAQLASKRSGSAKAKTRSEVAGSTKKIYKQKGTGRARHGSIRAPVFVGGGKAHGPVPRDYAYEPPRKMRKGAMRAALSHKVQQGQLLIVDHFELEAIKTQAVVSALKQLGAKGALIVDNVENVKLKKSVRNLAADNILPPEGLNAYDILRHPFLILTQRSVEAVTNRGRV